MEEQQWWHVGTQTDRWIGQEDVNILGPNWQKRLRTKNYVPYLEAHPEQAIQAEPEATPEPTKPVNANTLKALIRAETDLDKLDKMVEGETRAGVLRTYKDRIQELNN